MTVRALDRFPLPRPLARENTRENARENARETAASPQGLRLTSAQRELWSRQARDPGGAAPATAAYREIHGPLDPVLFAEALHRTVGEADALRMRVVDTPDGPRQRPIAIEPPGHGFPLCAADLHATEGMEEAGGGDGSGDPEAVRTALTWMRADLGRPFGPAGGPLFAYALFRVGDRRWLWYRRVHGVLLDAHGHRLVDRRVAEVYTALAAGEDPGPSPFGRLADLVAEDAAYRASSARERDRAYWRNRLAHLTTGEGPDGLTNAHGRLTPNTFHLDPETTAGLRELAASVRGSRTGLLLAAQALHLCRATGRRDVVLGLPLPGRTGPAALRVPGNVRNTVPLRLAVTPDATLAGLVRQADDAVREARAHQRYRRADLRRDLGLPAGHPALAAPLVDVAPAEEPITFAGAPSTLHPLVPDASGEEAAVASHFTGTTDGGLQVDTWGTGDAGAGHPPAPGPTGPRHPLHNLLTRLPALDPHAPLSAVSLVPDEEHERALREGNDTTVAVPPTTAIGPFESRAARTPGATALVVGDEHLTYAQLNARANRLARHLTTLGVRPGTFAAVDLPWSTARVVALLAVLKAGGACLFTGAGERLHADGLRVGEERGGGPHGGDARDGGLREGGLPDGGPRGGSWSAGGLCGGGSPDDGLGKGRWPDDSLRAGDSPDDGLREGGLPDGGLHEGGPGTAAPYREQLAPVCVLTTAAAQSARLAQSVQPARLTPPAGSARTVLMDDPALPALLAAHPPVDPARALTPHHPAYATRLAPTHAPTTTPNQPHTAVVPHSTLDNRLRWLQHHHPLTPADRVLLQGPLTPDTLAVELLWPLREGATLVLAAPEAGASAGRGRPGEAAEPGASMARRIRELDVTVARFDADALRRFLGTPEAGECGRLRHVLTGGEPPDRATVDRFHHALPHTALHHHFGPPEAATVAHRTCTPEGATPPGTVRPVWNARLHVLDPALRPCPPGAPGELYVAGAPLATGYAGHPARTAGRFPADPYGPPGTRMYRTGRRARRHADGGVELLGAHGPGGEAPAGGPPAG
ncbi:MULTISPECIES: AMP-binding protein [Streptomyces]|uniref:AMP-binding protein n=1 Tax=Streptomyces TaxID=1883 RepID=UPI00163B84FB|nr:MULTISPECIES: AMP-binding protein [Streptomyces]MBC2876973.1 AMP-binding protein [Streptomyces sp. TYQ1024]UBI35999.1 AMP-binding protein [Streptomyces mobaraensis]UKW28592.1 AMP-binding protein [Streptomyces sp. TYQ1024]